MCKRMEILFDKDGNIKSIKMESVKRDEAKDFYAELEALTGKAASTEVRKEFHAAKSGVTHADHVHN